MKKEMNLVFGLHQKTGKNFIPYTRIEKCIFCDEDMYLTETAHKAEDIKVMGRPPKEGKFIGVECFVEVAGRVAKGLDQVNHLKKVN